MTSTSIGNGEFVWAPDGSTPMSISQIGAQQAANLAALMGNRERFDYVWDNSTQRGQQAGMRQSSRGYQLDTKTEWMFDAGAWRLALPYVEFKGGSLSIAAQEYKAQTGWSVDSAMSTDASLVTVSGNVFTFARAGIYAISCTASLGITGDNAFQNYTTDSAHLEHVSISGFFGNVGTLAIPFFRIAADDTPLWLWAYNSIASNITDRTVRIGRLG